MRARGTRAPLFTAPRVLASKIEYDRLHGRFLAQFGGALHAISRDYETFLWRASLPSTQWSIDVNDDPVADVVALPACPPRNVPITVEVGMTCPPGQIAVIELFAAGASLPVLLTPAPSHGRVFVKFPNVVIGAGGGAPGVFVFRAGCYDPATQTLTRGQPVAWLQQTSAERALTLA